MLLVVIQFFPYHPVLKIGVNQFPSHLSALFGRCTFAKLLMQIHIGVIFGEFSRCQRFEFSRTIRFGKKREFLTERFRFTFRKQHNLGRCHIGIIFINPIFLHNQSIIRRRFATGLDLIRRKVKEGAPASIRSCTPSSAFAPARNQVRIVCFIS